MEFITDYRVERYALDTKWQDLPEKVQTWAKMCGIDLMSALVLGSYGRQFAAGTKLAKTVGLTGEIPVVGDEQTYNLLGAAISMVMMIVVVACMVVMNHFGEGEEEAMLL